MLLNSFQLFTKSLFHQSFITILSPTILSPTITTLFFAQVSTLYQLLNIMFDAELAREQPLLLFCKTFVT